MTQVAAKQKHIYQDGEESRRSSAASFDEQQVCANLRPESIAVLSPLHADSQSAPVDLGSTSPTRVRSRFGTAQQTMNLSTWRLVWRNAGVARTCSVFPDDVTGGVCDGAESRAGLAVAEPEVAVVFLPPAIFEPRARSVPYVVACGVQPFRPATS